MDMTVYSKTNAGRLLAFGQKPGMSHELRDLLKRVDGKTPCQQLFRLPGDAERFAELCKQQLVQIAPGPWRNSSVLPASLYVEPENTLRPDAATSAQDDPVKKSEPHLSLVGSLDNDGQNSKIKAIQVMMVGFIQAHLPEHADVTLPEIKALASEAHLLCMLSGYVNFINPTGRAGQQHIQELLLTLAGEE